jgi:hypothetical protein
MIETILSKLHVRENMKTLNALEIRRRLGSTLWGPPTAWGPDGFAFRHKRTNSSIVVTVAIQDDGEEWIHASIAHQSHDPTYRELKKLYSAVFTHGYAYQIFVPPHMHVNIHEHALHLWGRLDGKPVLPEFGKDGSI